MHRTIVVTAFGLAATCAQAQTPVAPDSSLRSADTALDLSAPFHTRSPWQFVVTQGPAETDYGGNPAPGLLTLCLTKQKAGPCVSKPIETIRPFDKGSLDWGPRYLEVAKVVYPQGTPLLEIVTASMHAGDGGQVVITQLLKYDRGKDAFEQVYVHDTGANNNEETRFVTVGTLKGDVISADPTNKAPYGYWIVVSRFTSAQTYQQVLRYRSATTYNDGNNLAVIDSEMPNIERRLGLWKLGQPLPLPAHRAKPCEHPALKHMELWCG